MSTPSPSPSRYRTSGLTLAVDRFMNWAIRIGGIMVIASVLGILVFITSVALPLWTNPRVASEFTVEAPATSSVPLAFGIDEWGELPFTVDRSGRMAFSRISPAASGARQVLEQKVHDLRLSASLATAVWSVGSQHLVAGTTDGRIIVVDVHYSAVNDLAANTRRVTSKPEIALDYTIAATPQEGAVTSVAYGATKERALAVALLSNNTGSGTRSSVKVLTFTMKQSLDGESVRAPGDVIDLTAQLGLSPIKVMIDHECNSVLVVGERELAYFWFNADEGTLTLRQRMTPFEDAADGRITSCDYLFGDVTVIVGNASGEQRKLSLFTTPAAPGKQADPRRFRLVGTFDPLPGPSNAFAASVRNKGFVVSHGQSLSLRQGTTLQTRWDGQLPFAPAALAFGPKYDRLMAMAPDGRLASYRLYDPHPEFSVRALFGSLWYEGHSQPKYDKWQTSGSDDYEPKFSFWVLIFGTLKATFYAMLIATPIALLAALYTAEFMHPRLKTVIKPTIELMAALPSVVLGFMAALWLAPLIETRVPSLILAALAIPTAALLLGAVWHRVPDSLRALVKPGREVMIAIPLCMAVGACAWWCGPGFEWLVFSGDFRKWWIDSTGLSYEQRNSLVVGIAMGFSVIPIIYTIAEDSLSNVPNAIRSASLAMGASRWQTALRIVVPTASAGIFSALMIGLGRAIGETMIVVMATGGTGVIDLNIFNGLRSLSANIAIEMPEAPQGGTLYRILFLSAVALFALTFTINTAAELLRQHLREKYKTV